MLEWSRCRRLRCVYSLDNSKLSRSLQDGLSSFKTMYQLYCEEHPEAHFCCCEFVWEHWQRSNLHTTTLHDFNCSSVLLALIFFISLASHHHHHPFLAPCSCFFFFSHLPSLPLSSPPPPLPPCGTSVIPFELFNMQLQAVQAHLPPFTLNPGAGRPSK